MLWILIALVAFALLAGCKKEEAKPQERLTDVSVIKITPRDTPVTS